MLANIAPQSIDPKEISDAVTLLNIDDAIPHFQFQKSIMSDSGETNQYRARHVAIIQEDTNNYLQNQYSMKPKSTHDIIHDIVHFCYEIEMNFSSYQYHIREHIKFFFTMVKIPLINLLKMICFCYNTHFP